MKDDEIKDFLSSSFFLSSPDIVTKEISLLSAKLSAHLKETEESTKSLQQKIFNLQSNNNDIVQISFINKIFGQLMKISRQEGQSRQLEQVLASSLGPLRPSLEYKLVQLKTEIKVNSYLASKQRFSESNYVSQSKVF